MLQKDFSATQNSHIKALWFCLPVKFREKKRKRNNKGFNCKNPWVLKDIQMQSVPISRILKIFGQYALTANLRIQKN